MGIFNWGNKEKTAKKWQNLGDKTEDPEKKQKYYQKALEIWSSLGDKVDALEDKIRYYNKALELDPENTHSLIGKGYALGFLGRYEEAISYHDAVLEKDPENSDALLGKGYALRKLRRYEEAIKCYDTAIETNPDNIEAWIEKGYALRRQKKYEEAIEVAERALDIDPENGLLWYDKASALLTIKRYREAMECFERARRFEPRLPMKAQMRYAARKVEEEGRISEITEEKTSKYLQAIKKLESRVKKAEKLISIPENVYELIKNKDSLDLKDTDRVSREIKEIDGANKTLTKLIMAAKPDLSIDLEQTAFGLNKWQKSILTITNKGNAHAFNVHPTFPADVEVKKVTPVSVKAGVKETVEVAIKPLIAGDVPLEVILTGEDGKKRRYEDKQEIWLNVSEGAPEFKPPEVTIEKKEGPELSIDRETEFYQGFIRFRMSVTNNSPYMVNDVSLDFGYDDVVLRMDRHEPHYMTRGNKIILGNITCNYSKNVVAYFDPLTCTGSVDINCQISYRDAKGLPKAIFMETERLETICPAVETESDLNIGRLKEFIERLPYRDSNVYQLQTGFDIDMLKTIAREVIQKQELKHIRTFYTKDRNRCEIWYYGEKLKGQETVVIVVISSHTRSIELFGATQTKETLSELLDEVGSELKGIIEERTAGKGGVQQVINVSIEDSVVTRPEIGFGAEGREKNFCPSCGAEVPEGARFCINCGEKLE